MIMILEASPGSDSNASEAVNLLKLRRAVYEAVVRGEKGQFSAAENSTLNRAVLQYERGLRQKGSLVLGDGSRVRCSDRFRRTSIRPEDGRILFALIVALEPECIIELGTSLGASALFMAAAVHHVGKGAVHTIELNAEAQAIARAHISEAGFSEVTFHLGSFQELLPPLLTRLTGVRFAFIDGHHKERPTWNYFRQFLAHAARPAVLVFDDIGWSDEMVRVWRKISEHPSVSLAVSTDKLGIVLVGAELPEASGGEDDGVPTGSSAAGSEL